MNHLPSGISALLGKGRILSVPNPPPLFFFFASLAPKKPPSERSPMARGGLTGFALKRAKCAALERRKRCWNCSIRTGDGGRGNPNPPPQKKKSEETNPKVFRFGASPVRIHQSDG